MRGFFILTIGLLRWPIAPASTQDNYSTFGRQKATRSSHLAPDVTNLHLFNFSPSLSDVAGFCETINVI